MGAENDRIDKVRFDRAAKIAALQNEIEQLERTRPQRIAEPAVAVADKLTQIRQTKDDRVKRLREAGNDKGADILEDRYSAFRNELNDLGTTPEAFALVDREYQKAEGADDATSGES